VKTYFCGNYLFFSWFFDD